MDILQQKKNLTYEDEYRKRLKETSIKVNLDDFGKKKERSEAEKKMA